MFPRNENRNDQEPLNALFLMGCFPVDFQEVKRPLGTKSVKRPIKVGKRPINEGKRPIKAKVLVGVSVGSLMGCFRAPPPWRKTAPLKRPIKRSMKRGYIQCSPATKIGTRARSHVPPERKPERGYIRQNHPFTKPPFSRADDVMNLVLTQQSLVSGEEIPRNVCHFGGRLMHHQNVSLQNAPSKRTLLTSLKRSKAGPPQLKRSKKYVLMVHFAVIRFDGASGACQSFVGRASAPALAAQMSHSPRSVSPPPPVKKCSKNRSICLFCVFFFFFSFIVFYSSNLAPLKTSDMGRL